MKRKLAVGVVGVVAVLVGCTPSPAGDSPGAGGSPSDRVVAAAVGQCRTYTHRQGESFSEQSTPVACAEEHTAETFFVTQVPDDKQSTMQAYWDRDEEGAAPFPDGDYISAQLEQCQVQLARWLGRQTDDIPGRFALRWFGPSRGSWSQGDRALRCDVVLPAWRLDTEGERQDRLINLPAAGMANYMLVYRAPDWAYCVRWTEARGTWAAGTCPQARDTYVSLGGRRLWAESAAWAGREVVANRAEQWCTNVVTNATSRSMRLLVISPTRATWQDGSRRAECLVRIADWDGARRAPFDIAG